MGFVHVKLRINFLIFSYFNGLGWFYFSPFFSWCLLAHCHIGSKHVISRPTRVPGRSIGDCAEISNNLVPRGTKLSAIDVTSKAFFERLYVVLGLSPFEPRVKCPYAPTLPPLTHKLFLDFRAIVFPSGPSFFISTRFTK